MITTALLEYLRQQLQAGVSGETIKSTLLAKGWNAADVDEAFAALQPSPAAVPLETASPVTPDETLTTQSPAAETQPQVTVSAPQTTTPPADGSGVSISPGPGLTESKIQAATSVQPSVLSETVVKSSLPGSAPMTGFPSAGGMRSVEKTGQKAGSLKKPILVILIILLITAATGAGAFAYWQVLNNPQKIFKPALAKILTVKSVQFYGKLTGTLAKGPTNYSGDFSGGFDRRDPLNPSGSLSLTLNQNTGAPTLGGDLMFFPKTLYLKLRDLPDLGLGSVDIFKGFWIKFDLTSLVKTVTTGLPGVSTKSLETSGLKTPELEKLALQTAWLKITGRKPDAVLDGIKTSHYLFQLDQTAVEKFLDQSSGLGVTEEQINQTRQAWKKLKTFTGEAYLGRDDSLLYRLLLTIETDEGRFTLDLNLRQYDQPLGLAEPEGGKTFEQLLAEATPPATLETDSDNDGLPDRLEKIYGTDPQKADTDGDGFKDGEEVCNGYNPLGPGKMPVNMESYPKPRCAVKTF